MVGLGLGLGLSQPVVAAGGAPADDLATSLAALEAAGKLVCAWFLPSATPSQYLTLSGANVNGWTAAYGTQKVDLAFETAAPQWDATLFSNKGGVTFNGSTQRFLATGGNLANWPDASTDIYMLAAVVTQAAADAFAYGTSGASRTIGRSVNAPYLRAGTSSVSGTANTFNNGTAHTVGAVFDIGGTSVPYLDGAASGAGVSTATAALTINRVRLGANSNSSASGFWNGTIACAAILNNTASLSDFTALDALMLARVT